MAGLGVEVGFAVAEGETVGEGEGDAVELGVAVAVGIGSSVPRPNSEYAGTGAMSSKNNAHKERTALLTMHL